MKADIEYDYRSGYTLKSNNNTFITFSLVHVNRLIETLSEIKDKSDKGLLLYNGNTVDRTCVHLSRHNNKCCTLSNLVYYDDIDNILYILKNNFSFISNDNKLSKNILKDKSIKELKFILAHVDRKRKEKANEKASCN